MKVFCFSYDSIIDAARKRVCQLKHTFGFIYDLAGLRELPGIFVEGVKEFLRAATGGSEIAPRAARC